MFPHLKDTCLYYPASGRDYLTPLTLFLPHIREFWFVDPAYFPRATARRLPPPILRDQPRFVFLGSQITESPASAAPAGTTSNKKPPHIRRITPLTITERCRDSETDCEFVIHWRRGDGRRGLARVTSPLGVFFQRGEGGGEGGSGGNWLHSKQLEPVLEKLTDGGLVVTDGSTCGKTYAPLRAYRASKLGPGAVKTAAPFTGNKGRRFECVGYAGERKGPTLIWRVTKPRT